MMNDTLDQNTKNFLSDLAVLLSDYHVISLITDYDTIRFVFDDESVVSFDRFVDNKLVNLKSIKYFSDYVPKCMRDMPGEAINECNKALEDKDEIMENETEIYDDSICDECYKCKYFHDDYSNCQGAEEVCFDFIKNPYYNKD